MPGSVLWGQDQGVSVSVDGGNTVQFSNPQWHQPPDDTSCGLQAQVKERSGSLGSGRQRTRTFPGKHQMPSKT